MKIMINLLSSGSGGAMSYVRNLLPLLVNRFTQSSEHDLVLLLYKKHRDEIGSIPNGIEIIEITKERGGAKRVLWEMFTVPRLVTNCQVDVFYTPYQLAPKVKGVKTVTMIRNMEPFLFKKYRYDIKNYFRNLILQYSSAKTLRRSNKVIAVSEFAQRQCTQGLGMGSDNIIQIYHGRDTRFTAEPNKNDKPLLNSIGLRGDYLFTCGSILPYRRLEYIIDAFSQWPNAEHYQLVVAGSGNDNGYSNMIAELINASPVGDNILMVGHVSPDTMRVLYRCCRLFVTATDIEACPNMGIEALSSGCHILSSDNDPMPEIFRDSASYFSSADTGKLKEALPKAWDAAEGVNLAALARAADFSWQNCAVETYNVLVGSD